MIRRCLQVCIVQNLSKEEGVTTIDVEKHVQGFS